MEHRLLGSSGFQIPALTFGTATFGGNHPFFKAWGTTDHAGAKRLVDICLDAGVNMFDTADVYSHGSAEEILGTAIKGRRDKVLISTKSTFRMSDDPNDIGSSRHHLTKSVEDSLRRLQTDYIDLYYLHGFDAQTSIEETLQTLDDLVQSGKIRYIGCSNFSGWHLMKSLAISERYGWAKYVAHQAYYALVSREFEWELMPLALDQNVGTVVWSPLSAGRLTGKYRRNQPIPENARIAQGGGEGPTIPDDWFYNLIDVMDEISAETGRSLAQIALNWLLHRPSVTSIVIGARNEEQLKDNLAATEWSLTDEQITRLDKASAKERIYPYWHQMGFAERNPPAVPTGFED